MKFSGKFKKGLAYLSLMTIGFSSLVTPIISSPLIVSADTEDSSDSTSSETTNTKGSGNINQIGSGALIDAYKKKSAYNFSTQYAITYNYLKGTFLSNSEYVSLFTGSTSNEAFNVGVGTYLKSKPNIGQSAEITTNDIANTSLENNTKDVENASSESSKNATKIAKTLASSILNDVIKYYGSNATVSDSKELITWGKTPKRVFYLEGVSDTPKKNAKLSGAEKEALLATLTQEIYLILSNRKNAIDFSKISSSDTEGTQKDVLVKAYKEAVISGLNYKNLGNALFVKNTGATKSFTYNYNFSAKVPSSNADFATRSGSSSNNSYISSFANANIGGFPDSVKNAITNSGNIKTNRVGVVARNQISIGGKTTFEVSDSVNANTKNNLASLFALQYYTKISSSDEKAFNNSVKEKINKINTDDLNKLSESSITAYSSINLNGSLLVYTPIEVYNDNTVANFNAEDYNKLLKKQNDELKSTESSDKKASIVDSNGSQRALQLQDLILASTTSDSSKLMVGTKNSNRGYPILTLGDSTAVTSKKSLRQYLGIYYGTGASGKLSDLKSSDFSNLNVKLGSSSGIRSTNAMYKAITSSKTYSTMNYGNQTLASQSIIALASDNYGNIIASETGDVVIPYWQNDFFVDGIENNKISANVAMKDNIEQIKNLVNGSSNLYSLSGLRSSALKSLDNKEYYSLFNNSSTVQTTLAKFSSSDSELFGKMASTNGTMSNEDYASLAMIITLATSSKVKAYNDKYLKALDDGVAFYAFPTASEYLNQESYEENKLARWTAASVIQKIGYIFDYGLWDTIRLTNAQSASNLYDSLVTWVGNIFYTSNVSTTDTWQSVSLALMGFVLAFLIVYGAYLAFQIFRGIVTFKSVVIKVLTMIFVMLVPFIGYNSFNNAIINKPADVVLKSAVKQNLVVNFLEDKQANKLQGDSELQQAYNELFGVNTGNKDFTNKNFMLNFYTTTNKDGIDVTDKTAMKAKYPSMNTETINTLTNQYNKKKLVSVQASIFDLYVWSTEQVYARNGNPDGKTYTNQSFFEYLYNTYDKESGAYADLQNYKEYSIDTSALYTKEQKRTGIYSDNKNTSELGKVTASELFYVLQYNSLADVRGTSTQLSTNLKSLGELTKIFNIDYNYTAQEGVYIPNSSDYQNLIRDLSMTADSRKQAYGSSASNNFSDFTLEAFGKASSTDLPVTVNSNLPTQDYFNLYTTIKQLMASQGDNQANINYDNARKATYNISYNTLSTVAGKYSDLEAKIGGTLRNNDMNSALQMATLLELYTNMNKELGFTNFPKDYEPESISMDNYLKMIYIPLQKYNFSSYTISDMNLTNLMQYITLTENVFVILLAFVAILLLFLFYLIYLVIFGVVMLFVILYNFIKNYIILGDFQNKSWKGTLYIYGVFGLIKLGLACLWWFAYNLLNSTYASYGGLTYNIVAIHSIVIIAYLLIAFQFAMLPVIKSVIEDRENLGANAFEGRLGKLKGKLNIKGKLTPSNIARKAGGAGRKAREIGKGSQKQIQRLVNSKVGKFVRRVDKMTKDNEATRTIKSKLSESAEKAMRRTAVGETLADKVFKKEVEGITQAQILNNKNSKYQNKAMTKYNSYKLKHREAGLSNKLTKNLSAGDIINTANQAMGLGTTVLTMSNMPQDILINQGSELVKHLMDSSGIVANITKDSEGNAQLNVDSSLYDLDSVEGRSAVALGLQTFAGENIPKTKRKFVSGKMSEIEGFDADIPMYSKLPNGSLLLDSSLNYGIDSETMRKVFYENSLSVDGYEKQLEKIKSKFSFEKSKWVDSEGVEHISEGNYVMIPKEGVKVTRQDTDFALRNMRKIDNSVRSRFNRVLPKENLGESLHYDLMNFTDEEQQEVMEFVASTQGVNLVDGNKLVYDENNVQASDAVHKFKRQFKSRNKKAFQSYKNLNSSLEAYVNKGDGYGTIETNVLNSKENSYEINKAMGQNYATKNNYAIALDKDNYENSKLISDSITIASATNKASKDTKFTTAVENKDRNKHILKQGLNSILRQAPNEVGNSLEYIQNNDSKVANTELFQSLKNDYTDLITKRNNKEISDVPFKASMDAISVKATEILDSSSMLEGFASKVDFNDFNVGMSEEKKEEVINAITTNKEKIKKVLNLSDIKDIDRNGINSEYVEKSKNLFGENGEAVYNKVNKVLNVKTNSTLNTSDGNIANSVLFNKYNQILEAKVDNDSPLVEKYKERINPDATDMVKYMSPTTRAELEKEKDTKKGDISDLLKSDIKSDTRNTRFNSAKPVNNIEEKVEKKRQKTNKKSDKLSKLIHEARAEGKLSQSDLDKYKKLLADKSDIDKKSNLENGLLNEAKLIEANNEMDDFNEKLDDFLNKLEKPEPNNE